MEIFDRENIDELLKIRQIRQYFPPSKICAIYGNFNLVALPWAPIDMGSISHTQNPDVYVDIQINIQGKTNAMLVAR